MKDYIFIFILVLQFNVIANVIFKFLIEHNVKENNTIPRFILVNILFFGHIMYFLFKKRVLLYIEEYNKHQRMINLKWSFSDYTKNSEYIKLDRYFKLKRLQNGGKRKRGFLRYNY